MPPWSRIIYWTCQIIQSHPLYSKRLKAKLGCIKDEAKAVIIKEIILMHPKCYSMALNLPNADKKRAKGVQSHVVCNVITLDDYKTVYLEQSLYNCKT